MQKTEESDLTTILEIARIACACVPEIICEDMDNLEAGERVELQGHYVDSSDTTISAYRAKGRGDKRIWFKNLKNYADAGDIMALVFQGGKLVIQNVTKGVMVAVLVVSSVGNLPSITS